MREVFDIALDIGAFANASHSGNESDGSVGLNHWLLLWCVIGLNTNKKTVQFCYIINTTCFTESMLPCLNNQINVRYKLSDTGRNLTEREKGRLFKRASIMATPLCYFIFNSLMAC